MIPAGTLGGEGQRVLRDEEASLFPRTVRPKFLLLLWITLALLGIAAAALAVAILTDLKVVTIVAVRTVLTVLAGRIA